jgi:hypothetical protein
MVFFLRIITKYLTKKENKTPFSSDNFLKKGFVYTLNPSDLSDGLLIAENKYYASRNIHYLK